MIESTDVRLSDLFLDSPDCRIAGDGGVPVNSLCYRSDACEDGSLFFCVPGFVRDGHDFAPDAVARGAVALCVERVLDIDVPQVMVPSVRRAMGPASSRFFGRPSAKLLTVGITGTNGKTTSAFLTAHLLESAGLPAGLMGTVQRRIGGVDLPAGRTTPEALDIQRDLAAMWASGDRAAVMEVSSHALDLDRVLGVDFRAVAFTNLTQDHLDYHGDLESYFAAKRRLFTDEGLRRLHPVAVVNIDDSFGRRLLSCCDRESVLTFSMLGQGEADLEMSEYAIGPTDTEGLLMLRGNALRRAKAAARDVAAGAAGIAAPVDAGAAGIAAPVDAGAAGWRLPLKTPLVGTFNIANTLTALGIGLGLGLGAEGMLAALRAFPGVPGRMEGVDAGQQFAVLVDYAHTPDSVRNVLQTARAITEGRLIAVLGCGGDRDKGKRPQMGRAAEELADTVVITSDNPRSEEPLAIIADILAGLEEPAGALVDPDRRQAIETAVRCARPGDVVLILGKGHESGQEFATETIPFDDREVAREALQRLVDGGPVQDTSLSGSER